MKNLKFTLNLNLVIKYIIKYIFHLLAVLEKNLCKFLDQKYKVEKNYVVELLRSKMFSEF